MSAKKRRVELGKDLVIALLTVSAVALLFFSPLIQGSGLLDALDGVGAESAHGAAAPQTVPAAAIPARMTAGSERGLYGVQYDQALVDALFDAAGPLLGEALEAASAPEPLEEGGGAHAPALSWRALLGREHIYFGYAGPIPLAALYGWLKPEGTASVPSGAARHILLAALPDGSLALCWQDEAGDFFRCDTELEAPLHLEPILERFTPNNAFFAFEDEKLGAALDPYVLFTGQDLHAPVYQSACPVSLTDSAQISKLLSALSFSDLNRAAGSDGCVIFVDGDDTMRLYPSGLIRCHAGQGRYRAGPGADGAVRSAWNLASAALEPLCGAARLSLLGVREQDGAYTVTFGYRLNGSEVYLMEQGWCAQFTVRNGSVTDFTCCLRTYAASGRNALLLPAEKAAAVLAGLTGEALELAVQYPDGGGEETQPRWVGQ